MKIIIITTVSLAILFLCLIVEQGIRKTEDIECIKWQGYQAEFESFYMTDWQLEQCADFDFGI